MGSLTNRLLYSSSQYHDVKLKAVIQMSQSEAVLLFCVWVSYVGAFVSFFPS